MPIQKIHDVDLRLRRFAAFFLDVLVVVALGGIIGTIFKSYLLKLDDKTSYLIGFTIALLYHGISNSLLFAGQSIGKLITKLKVVSKSGGHIGIVRSLLRSFFIVYGFFLEPIHLPNILDVIFSFIFVPFFIAQLIYAIYPPGNRSMHDFVCGSYVVDSETKEIYHYNLPIKPLKAIGVLSIVLFSILIFLQINVPKVDKDLADRFKKTHNELLSFHNVINASIEYSNDKYLVLIQTTDLPSECHNIAVKSVSSLANNLEISDSNQVIQVIVVRGYNINIYESWEHYEHTLPMIDWSQQFSKYGS